MSEATLTSRGCPSGLEPAAEPVLVDPSPFVRNRSGRSTLDLAVQGARCAGCLSKIENALLKLDGVESARLNLSTGRLSIVWRTGAQSSKAFIGVLADLGYRAHGFDAEEVGARHDEESRALLRALAVAGFASANIMLLSVAVWAGGGDMGAATRDLLHWVSAAIAIPAAAYAGRPFFRSAWASLKAGSANMDVPISLAVILSIGISLYESAQGGAHAYFDAAVMLLFFLLIGRYLDHMLRARARRAAQDLLALESRTANRLHTDGRVETVATRTIAPGDRIVLFPGDRAPVDGVIVEGGSSIDCSLISGESAPVRRRVGEALHAGALNLSSRIVLEASRPADQSLVAELARLIELGEQGRSRYRRMADRAAALYVPVVHSMALATFAAWLFLLDASLRTAATNAIAVLIITCPCALGLAAPVVQIVATGRLFRAGVLVKSGDALERLAGASYFVFDKTGTLTYGRQRVVNREALPAGVLESAAQLARASRHPVSRAIVEAAGPGPVAADAREIEGLGVEGAVESEPARLGRADWVGSAAPGSSGAAFRRGSAPPVWIAVDDDIRPDARAVCEAIAGGGHGIEILTGDAPAPARRISEMLGGIAVKASLDPAAKLARIGALAASGEKVIVIGDGMNDAPSLAAGHASMSPGSAADVSRAAADFVYLGEGLSPVIEAFKVARAARQRALENFAFAALYNLLAAPLAAFGFVTPLIAALAMSGSSIIVTLNALRLSKESHR